MIKFIHPKIFHENSYFYRHYYIIKDFIYEQLSSVAVISTNILKGVHFVVAVGTTNVVVMCSSPQPQRLLYVCVKLSSDIMDLLLSVVIIAL